MTRRVDSRRTSFTLDAVRVANTIPISHQLGQHDSAYLRETDSSYPQVAPPFERINIRASWVLTCSSNLSSLHVP